jgi:hypothetical protein
MRYMLLLHYPEAASAGALDDEAMAAGRDAFVAYAATLQAAGVLVSAEVLRASEASTTLSMTDGVLQVQDGPFADTKEQLGGVVLIDVADLDAALGWAALAPPIDWGAVEVRPSATHTVEGVWVTEA